MNFIQRLSTLFFAALVWYSAKAVEPQELLGLPYTDPLLSELRSSFQTVEPVESFLPFLKVYKIDYQQDGFAAEYNSDVALYKIALFDSGYSYESYKGELPFGAFWGWTLREVEKKSGLLDFDEQNPYVRKYITDNYVIDFYFEDGKLYHVKLTSTLKRLQDNFKKIKLATGVRLLPDGKVAEGDVLDGTGTMTWGNGTALYKGEWSYGLPHGKGQYLDSFGNKYEGEFKLGFFWGDGKFFSKPYQYSYTGQYAMGTKHGVGKIGYANNTTYEGDWLQDIMDGEGVYFAGKNYVYKGEMKNNAFNGKGVLETPQGRISGTFLNGKPHGVCKQETLDSQQSVMGNYINGLKNGIFTINLNGEKTEVRYENDIEISNEKVEPEMINSGQQ